MISHGTLKINYKDKHETFSDGADLKKKFYVPINKIL